MNKEKTMDFLKTAKLRMTETFDKAKKTFDSSCNTSVKLLMQNRELERAIRSDDGKEYTFFEKTKVRIGDVFVDEANRLLIVTEISNLMYSDKGYKYKKVAVEKYVNKSGIVYLASKNEINDSNKIVIESGRDVILNNSQISNSSKVVLSILSNLELKPAWEAAKSDLSYLYDYEKFFELKRDVDSYFENKSIKDAKFKKHIEKAKEIAGVLGTFIGAILGEIITSVNS